MEEAKIKTEVAVSLNQNDIVELMLEEQVEFNENKLKVFKSELVKAQDKYDDLKLRLIKNLVTSNGVRNTAIFKKFAEAAELLNLSIVNEVDVVFEKKQVGRYSKWNLNSMQIARSPIKTFKEALTNFHADNGTSRYGYKFHEWEVITTEIPVSISLHFLATDESTKKSTISIDAGEITNLKLNAKSKEFIHKLEKIAEEIYKLKANIHECDINLFELEYDNKRSKNKFVKALLANSNAGQELVDLLSQIKGNNLLEIGTKK